MSHTKALSSVELGDAENGLVKAVFATFNVKDTDGDVTLPGAFTDGQPVRISAYGHQSWSGALPVGKGVIRSTDTEAILDGKFFLNTTGGRDTYETIKELGPLAQWSYGFDTLDAEQGEHDGEEVQFLKSLDVHEVSPVLLGAGVDTRTLEIKAAKMAIAPRSTPCTDAMWDGPMMKARLRNDGDAAYYRQAFAWVDPDGDPDVKASYKFIHHMVGEDGTVGAANVVACTTGIGVLNGGRGGTTIPAGDRQGVYNHLARHLRDADITPPELKSVFGPLSDDLLSILGDVSASKARLDSFGTTSGSKEGRTLSAANRERIRTLLQALRDHATGLEEFLADTDPNKHRDQILRELIRLEQSRLFTHP